MVACLEEDEVGLLGSAAAGSKAAGLVQGPKRPRRTVTVFFMHRDFFSVLKIRTAQYVCTIILSSVKEPVEVSGRNHDTCCTCTDLV